MDKLSKGTSHVIVYYYGVSPETAVAIEDIGVKVLSVTRRVSQVDKKQHTIAIRVDGDSESICSVESGTAVEMSDGVKDGAKKSPCVVYSLYSPLLLLLSVGPSNWPCKNCNTDRLVIIPSTRFTCLRLTTGNRPGFLASRQSTSSSGWSG